MGALPEGGQDFDRGDPPRTPGQKGGPHPHPSCGTSNEKEKLRDPCFAKDAANDKRRFFSPRPWATKPPRPIYARFAPKSRRKPTVDSTQSPSTPLRPSRISLIVS